MKAYSKVFSILFVLLLIGGIAVAEEGTKTESYYLWLGGHYTEFDDGYTKKVGEYNLGEDEFLPEAKFGYFSKNNNSYFRLDGHYYDENNVFGRLKTVVGDRFKATFQFRSLIKQEGQDMLEEMAAREYFPSTGLPGGKILSHELQDVGADYNVHRQELLAKASLLLERSHDVRIVAAHRTILKTGTEQKIASDHCFSCHLTSKEGLVDNRQHQFDIGIEGDLVEDTRVGYTFSYRNFYSDAPNTQAYYDPAVHPVNGGSGAEFTTRVNYDDTTLNYSSLPETEKMAHRVKFKRNFGNSYLASVFGYTTVENKGIDIQSKTLNGAINFATILNPKTRLLVKGSYASIDNDDVFVDIPTWREGRGGVEVDFDYTRYSVLNRKNLKLSGEVIRKINPQMTLSVLGGLDVANRDNYPVYDDGISTKKIYGQAKMRYRKGNGYTSSLKYRFETISDPFVSSKGLFEAEGRGELEPLISGFPFIFYFQREELRYQAITSEPTQVHKIDWTSTWSPNEKVNVNMGFNFKYDKNGDLDSLDVKNTMMNPNLYINMMPNNKWYVTAGYNYNYSKSRGPVTVALFDG